MRSGPIDRQAANVLRSSRMDTEPGLISTRRIRRSRVAAEALSFLLPEHSPSKKRRTEASSCIVGVWINEAEKVGASFLHLEPTIIKFEIIDGPPPDRENPEYPLARRIRLRAKELQQWGRPSIPIWRRYAPKVIPLKPSPGGSRKALLILRLIKEAPHIATLPRPERVATRERRARKAWGDFFTGLDSALIEGDG